MPLNITNLKNEIKAEIITQYGVPADANQLDKFCLAISTAVINHIKANAVVTSVTSTPNAQGGSSTLAGSAQGTIS